MAQTSRPVRLSTVAQTKRMCLKCGSLTVKLSWKRKQKNRQKKNDAKEIHKSYFDNSCLFLIHSLIYILLHFKLINVWFFNEKISTTKKQSLDEFSCQRWVLTCAYFAIQFPLRPVVTWRLQLHCEFNRTFLCFDLGKLIPTWMMSISQPWPIRNKKEIKWRNSSFSPVIVFKAGV